MAHQSSQRTLIVAACAAVLVMLGLCVEVVGVTPATDPERTVQAEPLGCTLDRTVHKVTGTASRGSTLQNSTVTYTAGGGCDWTIAISSPGAEGVTFVWNPSAVTVGPANPVDASDGTITVGVDVAPGQYVLSIVQDVSLNGTPFTTLTDDYTLTVVDGPTPTPEPTPTKPISDTIPSHTVAIEPSLNPATKSGADGAHAGGLETVTSPCPCPCPEGTPCPAIAQDAGDPIYLHSGEFYLYAVDLRIPGRGFDWAFARKYRSGVTFEGPLGHNWDFNYNRRLVLVTEGNATDIPADALPSPPQPGDVVRMDGLGRVDLYQLQANGSYQAPPGYYTQLTQAGDDSFEERDYRGQAATYSPPDAQGRARLTALRDRHGNSMSFHYNAENQLDEVVDTLGRSIQYAYDAAGRLSQVTDFLGRSITFTYDGNGDLVQVTTPAVTGTPNGNDFPQGKSTRYTYSSGFAGESLNHNLLTVTAPNEVAHGGPPYVELQYENDLNSPHLDRVVEQTLGGTNVTGVPAGGTITYSYESLALSTRMLAAEGANSVASNDLVFQTTVTDRNGNMTEYQFNAAGNALRVREFTNRDVRANDPAFYETQNEYNVDGQLTRTVYPEGNSVEYVYDAANPDRLQQGNLLQVVRFPDASRGGDQTSLETTYTYEPIYNEVRTVTGPRGNDTVYVPQNGGANNPARYTSTYTFDYEEGCDAAAIAARMGRTEADVAQLLSTAGVCAAPLGDLNADGLTDQVIGNRIRIQAPTANLLAGSNQAAVEGDTTQEILAIYAYNTFGQPVYQISPEGNVTGYTYFPATDPDGDGTPSAPPSDGRTLDAVTGGYLREVRHDAREIAGPGIPERRNRAACPNDLDSSGEIDLPDLVYAAASFGEQVGFPIDSNGNRRGDVQDMMALAVQFGQPCPGFTDIRTQYAYDPVGNVIRVVDGRGIATDYAVNQLNQVVQVTRAAAHDVIPPDPAEPAALTDFRYLMRFFYDHNDNLVVYQVEDRGNTSNVDGNPPAADLPVAVPNPDPVGGPAFADTVYKYDILDNPVETLEEVENGGSEFVHTRLRYDPNGNRVLAILPAGNAVVNVHDERDLLLQATRGAIAPPTLAQLAPGDPTDYDVRGGLPATTTYHYDGNRNRVEVVDAADTDGSAANNSGLGGTGDRTRFIYDGFDRFTSLVDAVGNQVVYQYDPASNLVRTLEFGPVGGTSPTSDGSDVLPRPVSSAGVVQAANLVNANLLAATKALYDELNRAFQTDQVLFVNTIATVRPPDVADGGAAVGKGNLTPDDDQAIAGISGVTIVGRVTQRTEYDRSSRLTFRVGDDSDTARLDHDGASRIIRVLDPAGNSVEAAYDDNSNLIELRETDTAQVPGVPAEVFLTSYFHDSLNRVQRRVNNLGHTFDYRYDSRDNLVAMSDAQGPLTGAFISRRAFAGGALTVGDINDFGNVSRSFYDGISRLTRQERVLTASGQGDGVNIGADIFGIKTATPAPDPAQGGGDGLIRTGQAYDRNSQGVFFLDDQGNVTLYLYDNLNRAVVETKGLTVNTTPLNKARVLGDRDVVAPTVDSIDNPDIIPEALVNAQLAAAKVRLDAVAALFPPLADRVDDNPPTTIVSGYDRDDNLLIAEDENDSETFHRYDALNRTIAMRVFRAGQTDSHVGDPVFAPAPITDPSNPSATFPAIVGTTKQDFQYDGLSRMTRGTDNNEPADNSDDSVVTHAYDSLSRRVEETQQIGSLPPQTVSSAWRAELLRSTLTYPDGRAVGYTYDVLDRLNTVADQGATEPIADYDYIGSCRVAERRHAINDTRLTYLDDTGSTDVGYDGLRRPVQLRHLRAANALVTAPPSTTIPPQNPGPDSDFTSHVFRFTPSAVTPTDALPDTLLVGFTHTYDRMGNKLTEAKLHAPGDSELYLYDAAYRLIQCQRGTLNAAEDAIMTPSPNTPLHSQWTLDGVGNWAQVDGETRQHSTFNEITVRNPGTPTAILSDDSGNETDDGTLTFAWDYAGRLRQAANKPDSAIVATYSYDALGRRIRKVVANSGALNGVTDFYLDGWREIEEHDGANALTQQVVYGRYIDEPLVLDQNLDGDGTARGSGDRRLVYHQNTLYSTFALTNLNGEMVEGYLYDAYGRQTVFQPGPNGLVEFGGDDSVVVGGSSGLGNPYLFTGRRFDPETGLYYYRMRYLNPEQGRFISRDPLGTWSDGLGASQAYVGNNPINRLDPLGLYWGEAWDTFTGYVSGVGESVKGVGETFYYAGAGLINPWGDPYYAKKREEIIDGLANLIYDPCGTLGQMAEQRTEALTNALETGNFHEAGRVLGQTATDAAFTAQMVAEIPALVASGVRGVAALVRATPRLIRAVARAARRIVVNPVRFIRSVRFRVNMWFIRNCCKKAKGLSQAESAKLVEKMRNIIGQQEAEFAEAFADATTSGRLTTGELQYLLDDLENITRRCTEGHQGFGTPEDVIRSVIEARPENLHGVTVTDPAAWRPVQVGPGVSPSSSTVDVPPPGSAPSASSTTTGTQGYTGGVAPHGR